MIKREVSKKEKAVKVTFSQPREGVSVVGDFNGWDPAQGKLQKRSNGTWSLSVPLAPGNAYQFRYVTDSGAWFNEDQADAQVSNEHGSLNSTIVL